MTRVEAAKLILNNGTAREQSRRSRTGAAMTRAWCRWKAWLISGTLAERYLADTRKIAVDRLPDTITESLRDLMRRGWRSGTERRVRQRPVPDRVDDRGRWRSCGIHRIALAETEGKVDKIDAWRWQAMGTVRLWPANGRLVVGEGIETADGREAARIPHFRDSH